jgi:hypothetical protein
MAACRHRARRPNILLNGSADQVGKSTGLLLVVGAARAISGGLHRMGGSNAFCFASLVVAVAHELFYALVRRGCLSPIGATQLLRGGNILQQLFAPTHDAVNDAVAVGIRLVTSATVALTRRGSAPVIGPRKGIVRCRSPGPDCRRLATNRIKLPVTPRRLLPSASSSGICSDEKVTP